MGNILSEILKAGIDKLSQEDIYELLLFANAVASIITTRKDALNVYR